jgi:hypothetical protein
MHSTSCRTWLTSRGLPSFPSARALEGIGWKTQPAVRISYFVNLRILEIHIFYNLQLFYWNYCCLSVSLSLSAVTAMKRMPRETPSIISFLSHSSSAVIAFKDKNPYCQVVDQDPSFSFLSFDWDGKGIENEGKGQQE